MQTGSKIKTNKKTTLVCMAFWPAKLKKHTMKVTFITIFSLALITSSLYCLEGLTLYFQSNQLLVMAFWMAPNETYDIIIFACTTKHAITMFDYAQDS